MVVEIIIEDLEYIFFFLLIYAYFTKKLCENSKIGKIVLVSNEKEV